MTCYVNHFEKNIVICCTVPTVTRNLGISAIPLRHLSVFFYTTTTTTTHVDASSRWSESLQAMFVRMQGPGYSSIPPIALKEVGYFSTAGVLA